MVVYVLGIRHPPTMQYPWWDWIEGACVTQKGLKHVTNRQRVLQLLQLLGANLVVLVCGVRPRTDGSYQTICDTRGSIVEGPAPWYNPHDDGKAWGGKMVWHINCHVRSFKANEVSVGPFINPMIFDIHVTSSCGRFLSISHGIACIIVFVEHWGSCLRDPKVPHDATHIE